MLNKKIFIFSPPEKLKVGIWNLIAGYAFLTERILKP